MNKRNPKFLLSIILLLLSVSLYAQYTDDPFQFPVILDTFPTGGVAWGDYNHDGFEDIFICNGPDEERWENLLFLNNGSGSFSRDLSAGTIVTDVFASMGASWSDFNNDGYLDILVANPNTYGYYDLASRLSLYVNQGNGSFIDIGSNPLVDQFTNINKYAAAWADVDNDGWVDVLVSNTVMYEEPAEHIFYRNNQDGTFSAVTNSLSAGASFMGGMAWADFDRDGDMDVVVAGGAPGQATVLYVNGGSDFIPVTLVAGGSAGYSRGVSWADYDNDGDFDCYITNAGETVGFGEANLLFRFDGLDGNNLPVMTRVGSAAGDLVTDTDFSIGSAWADFDNDGDLDLFVANDGGFRDGFMSRLYLNDGTGFFTKMTNTISADSSSSARGAAWADIENDGDLDLMVGRSGPNHLYINNGNDHHFLNIRLVGMIANKSAIGSVARIRTTVGGEEIWQMREVSSQTGYGSQNSLRLHFGLGDVQRIDSLIIEWAGTGLVERFADLLADEFLIVYEGESLNGKPLAVDDTAEMDEDMSVSIAVLENDSDPDEDVLFVYDIIQGTHGTAAINIDSTVTYTPNENFFGTDVFYYIISDGSVTKTDTAQVSITVKNVNDAPRILDLPDGVILLTDDSTAFLMSDFATDVDTPYEKLSWSFELKDSRISYSFDAATDSLFIFSGTEPGESILYVTLTDDSSASDHDSVRVQVDLPSAIPDVKLTIPANYMVKQNYPNPFNPDTRIDFGIPSQVQVLVEVFDITGKKITILSNRVLQAGYHSIQFSAADLPSGLYYYRIKAGQFESIKRMMLIK